MNLDIGQLQMLKFALGDIIDYDTDNSCSDPECCGGPYGDKEQRDQGIETLRSFGIEYDETVKT